MIRTHPPQSDLDRIRDAAKRRPIRGNVRRQMRRERVIDRATMRIHGGTISDEYTRILRMARCMTEEARAEGYARAFRLANPVNTESRRADWERSTA